MVRKNNPTSKLKYHSAIPYLKISKKSRFIASKSPTKDTTCVEHDKKEQFHPILQVINCNSESMERDSSCQVISIFSFMYKNNRKEKSKIHPKSQSHTLTSNSSLPPLPVSIILRFSAYDSNSTMSDNKKQKYQSHFHLTKII